LLDVVQDLFAGAEEDMDEEGANDASRVDQLMDDEEGEQDDVADLPEEEISTKAGKRLGRVRKAKMSEKLGSRWLRPVGLTKMKEMDISSLKQRSSERQVREQKALHDELFDYLEGGGDQRDPMTKLVDNESELPQPNFRKMVKHNYM
jgi:hypothetical protein